MSARDLVWWGFNDICPSTYTKGGHSRFNRLRARATVWQHHHKKIHIRKRDQLQQTRDDFFYTQKKTYTRNTYGYDLYGGRFYPLAFPVCIWVSEIRHKRYPSEMVMNELKVFIAAMYISIFILCTAFVGSSGELSLSAAPKRVRSAISYDIIIIII